MFTLTGPNSLQPPKIRRQRARYRDTASLCDGYAGALRNRNYRK